VRKTKSRLLLGLIRILELIIRVFVSVIRRVLNRRVTPSWGDDILGRPPGFRRRDIGRISLTAPAMTEDRRMAEEDAINDEYHDIFHHFLMLALD
jgi:hypothetical protein